MLTGCAVSRTVPFNEADFTHALKNGTSTVTGQAYVITKDGTTYYADHQVVVLAPVNAYTTENIRRRFVNGENLRSADPRIDKYLRSAMTDATGHFVIRGVPAGEYYVDGAVPWVTSYNDVDSDGISTVMHVNHEKLYFTRISLKGGQTMHITKWDQRNPVYDSFYAYGGTLW